MELFNGYVNLDRIIKILRFWGKWVFIQTSSCVISVPRLGSLPSRDTQNKHLVLSYLYTVLQRADYILQLVLAHMSVSLTRDRYIVHCTHACQLVEQMRCEYTCLRLKYKYEQIYQLHFNIHIKQHFHLHSGSFMR